MKLSRWLPPVLGFAVFLTTLFGLGLIVGDWTSRNLEMRALVSAVEDSESAMQWTDDQIQSIIKQYGANGTLKPAQQKKAFDALSEAAYEGNFAIGAAGEQVAKVSVLPWHGDIKSAQTAYLAHNNAWQDYMQTATDDPTVLFKTQALINSTFEKTEPLMKAAVPIPALFDLKKRVLTIFAPQPTTGPTQEVALNAAISPVLIG
ncbi:MAG: hypothetical protein Q7L55_07690 [Actinomycetota bacterium]|nr:hypothetical protein [Actinomycetota bacterium]